MYINQYVCIFVSKILNQRNFGDAALTLPIIQHMDSGLPKCASWGTVVYLNWNYTFESTYMWQCHVPKKCSWKCGAEKHDASALVLEASSYESARERGREREVSNTCDWLCAETGPKMSPSLVKPETLQTNATVQVRYMASRHTAESSTKLGHEKLGGSWRISYQQKAFIVR